VELATARAQPSLVAEAFRGALTSILFAGENGSRPRVLVFTSANPGDGKTTVVSNLAIATAGIGRSVLIVDADMRQPRMHEIFDLPNDRGLSDLLRAHPDEESLAFGINETGVAGVSLITGGSPTNAAADLLHSPNLAALLECLKRRYEMILIDTPPMLQMPDARAVGRAADAVVLVARAGQTSRAALSAASKRFSEDRTPVLGTILNGWNPTGSESGYYDYYRSATSRSSAARA
jgi:capsular exopolysaccharide synthesis family protein